MDEHPSTTGPQRFEQNPKAPSSRDEAEKEVRERMRREAGVLKKKRAIDILGGVKAFEDFTFERFPRAWSPEAFDAALRFDPDRSNLYFWGPSGVGKTHLSTAIAHRAWDDGRSVHFAVIPDFKERLRLFENHFDYDAKKRYVQSCISAQVLVIQELGRGSVSEMVQEAIWTILDRRLLERRNGLVITSNFPPEKIGEKYGGTILRRIEELCGPAGIVRFPERRAEAANG